MRLAPAGQDETPPRQISEAALDSASTITSSEPRRARRIAVRQVAVASASWRSRSRRRISVARVGVAPVAQSRSRAYSDPGDPTAGDRQEKANLVFSRPTPASAGRIGLAQSARRVALVGRDSVQMASSEPANCAAQDRRGSISRAQQPAIHRRAERGSRFSLPTAPRGRGMAASAEAGRRRARHEAAPGRGQRPRIAGRKRRRRERAMEQGARQQATGSGGICGARDLVAQFGTPGGDLGPRQVADESAPLVAFAHGMGERAHGEERGADEHGETREGRRDGHGGR
jgi:hypothetical protein